MRVLRGGPGVRKGGDQRRHMPVEPMQHVLQMMQYTHYMEALRT